MLLRRLADEHPLWLSIISICAKPPPNVIIHNDSLHLSLNERLLRKCVLVPNKRFTVTKDWFILRPGWLIFRPTFPLHEASEESFGAICGGEVIEWILLDDDSSVKKVLATD